MKFGEKLRELRLERNLTQRELAKKVGIEFTYLSKVENNRNATLAKDTIVKIAEALEADADELVELAGKKGAPPSVEKIISEKPSAMKFYRRAKSADLTEEEWNKLEQIVQEWRN